MATLERAVQIAAEAHAGQQDKSGAPYLLHPLRLMLRMRSVETMMAAVLHDVVEDSGWTLEQLRAEGFSDAVLAAVECLTKHDGEDYATFIQRVQTNSLARQVKLADLEDNLNLQRLAEITPKDLARLEKYHRAWRQLKPLEEA